MMIAEENELLYQHINQLVALSPAEYNEVLKYFFERSYKKYQFIVQEQELNTREHFILKGLVKSSFTDQDGKVHILQFAMEEWWFSDINAFNNRTATTLNIDCLEDTTTLSLSYDDKEKLCEAFPKMAYFFRKKYTSGNIALQQRVLSLLSNSAKERYEKLIEQYPQLPQRVPKALLAAYLGVSRETLSRLY